MADTFEPDLAPPDRVVTAICATFSVSDQLAALAQSGPYTAVVRNLYEPVSFVLRVASPHGLRLSRIDHPETRPMDDLVFRDGAWHESVVELRDGDSDSTDQADLPESRPQRSVRYEEVPMPGTFSLLGGVYDADVEHVRGVGVRQADPDRETSAITEVLFDWQSGHCTQWLRRLRVPGEAGQLMVVCNGATGEVALLGTLVATSPLPA